MARRGIDYAWHRALDVARLLEAGVTFAGRYLSHDPGKDLSPAEAETLAAAGIDLFVVWETAADRALDGRAAGAADAAEAAAKAARCGMPADRPVYFAVDFDARPEQLPAVDDYLAGAADEIGTGRVGVYGSFRVVEHCAAGGTASFFWQTLAWSGRRVSRHAQVYQHRSGAVIGGLEVDLDTAYRPDFGQWRPA